jgi:endonuclease YncB( thermonuclease family)
MTLRRIPVARIAAAALGAIAAAGAHSAAAEEEIEGTVTEIVSGDTLVVRAGERDVVVRLADVNAPQDAQFFAPGARGLLSGMLRNREVRVEVTGRDDAGQVFGRVHFRALDVNLEMVKRGAAFVCWDFPVDTYFTPWEAAARRQQIGLWSSTWEITARSECLRRPPGPWPARN